MNNLENHPYYYYYKLGDQKLSTKLFSLYENEKLSNYKKVIDIVQTSFFPKKSIETVINFFDEVFSTNKYYVRYHNGNTQ